MPFPDTRGYLTYKQTNSTSSLQPEHEEVSNNTANKIPWRIDGASFGVRYWVVPEFKSAISPSKIDVFILDQTEWLAELWSAVDARDSTHMSDERAAKLRIANHLSRALELWCEKTSNFEEEYRKLPFGSSITFPAIKANVAEMEFNIVPNVRLQDSMLPVQELQHMWGFETTRIPPSITIDELRLQKNLQKSISLVTLVSDNETPMIMKSGTETLSGIYHEIKILLTLPPHRNIIQRPLYLVTTFCPRHEEYRVCGFILKYHKAGALQEALPRRLCDGTLTLRDQIRWAQEITTALLHVRATAGQFYSDLKMDSILLSSDDDKETVILADFEQSRNLWNWAPPEVLCV